MAALDNLAKIPNRAMARAINNVLRHARTQSVKNIGEEYTIAAGDLKRKITLGLASAARASGYIEVKTEAIPLGYFSPTKRIVQSRRGKRVGVSVKVKRRGARKLVRGGFQPFRIIGSSTAQKRKIFKGLGIKKVAARGRRKGKVIETIIPKVSLSYATAFRKAAEEKLYEIYDQDLYIQFNKELENYLSLERSKG